MPVDKPTVRIGFNFDRTDFVVIIADKGSASSQNLSQFRALLVDGFYRRELLAPQFYREARAAATSLAGGNMRAISRATRNMHREAEVPFTCRVELLFSDRPEISHCQLLSERGTSRFLTRQ